MRLLGRWFRRCRLGAEQGFGTENDRLVGIAGRHRRFKHHGLVRVALGYRRLHDNGFTGMPVLRYDGSGGRCHRRRGRGRRHGRYGCGRHGSSRRRNGSGGRSGGNGYRARRRNVHAGRCGRDFTIRTQRRGKLLAGLKPLIGILGHRAPQYLDKPFRYLGIVRADIDRFLIGDLEHQLRHRVTDEGQMTGSHLIQADREREQIRTPIHFLAGQLLR